MAERDPNGRSVPESDDAEPTAGDTEPVDISETTAPSIGPNTVIEKDSPQERLARRDQSDTDAMGLDKHRKVIGGRYSASVARQATLYAVSLAVLAALVIGFVMLAGELDQAPAKYEDQAPWAQPNAPQEPPPPLQ